MKTIINGKEVDVAYQCPHCMQPPIPEGYMATSKWHRECYRVAFGPYFPPEELEEILNEMTEDFEPK